MEKIHESDLQKDAIAASPNILSLPVALTVSVGAVRITIEQLLALQQDSILTLESKIDDPVEILIGDRVVARGELVESGEVDCGIGVRIIALIEKPADRS